MTKKETVNRNIGLTFDFIRQVVDDPNLLDAISNDSVLEFVEKDFVKKEKKDSAKQQYKRKYLRVKSRLEVI